MQLLSNGATIGKKNEFRNSLIYVGGSASSSNTTTTTNSFTISFGNFGPLIPGEEVDGVIATGDIAIVAFASAATGDLIINATASGFTTIADLYANDTYDVNLWVGYKILTETLSQSINVICNTGSAAFGSAITAQIFRNINATTPEDVAATTLTQTNTGLPNPPSISPITPNSIIVVVGANGNIATTDNELLSNSSLTKVISIAGDGANGDVSISMGHVRWTGGVYDPPAFSFSSADSTNNSAASVTIALRPQNPLGIFGLNQEAYPAV